MSNRSDRHPRTAVRSLWRVFSAPFVIAVASTVGLISALVGDGLMDVIAWIGLGVPTAVGAWFVYIRKAD